MAQRNFKQHMGDRGIPRKDIFRMSCPYIKIGSIYGGYDERNTAYTGQGCIGG